MCAQSCPVPLRVVVVLCLTQPILSVSCRVQQCFARCRGRCGGSLLGCAIEVRLIFSTDGTTKAHVYNELGEWVDFQPINLVVCATNVLTLRRREKLDGCCSALVDRYFGGRLQTPSDSSGQTFFVWGVSSSRPSKTMIFSRLGTCS